MEDRPQHVDPDAGAEPPVSLPELLPEAEGESHQSQLLDRLRKHVPEGSRYQLQGEIARGGMGAILKIWDEDLRRNLAMKVILGRAEASSGGGSPPVDRRLLARFLEEAQVTGQLDHPGIVPVHELGLDSTGRVYFTMKLVKGRDLKQVLELVFEEREGWNETRALGVILKVCESVAYAHSKGVVHRDLKPANVMVGSFGEVYVMDWGLARVLGRKDSHDLRLVPEQSTQSIRTARRDERDGTPDAPLLTEDGDVVGTPSYMPPEQARGEIEKLSTRSDVYSIGAILYHVLTRQAPYCPPGARVSNHAVLGMVLHGPPPPVEEIRRDAPAELVAIQEKAMARDASARYASTLELAEDLQAYLEGRVVRAHQTGAWIEARKWVRRNKPLAASLAAAVVLLVAGLATSLAFKSRADQKAADLSAANTTIGQRNTALEESTRVARRNLYVSTLAGAQSAMRLNEYATVRRLLASAPEDLRAWEWGYLNAAGDTSLLALDGDVAAFSPDGTRIVTASSEHGARIFDASTGKELVQLEGHAGAVSDVAFSPDGTRVLTASEDKTARLWDAATGKELARLEGHTGPVASAVFTRDGARIATASWNEFMRVWDARTGKELTRIPSRTGYVDRDTFSPDGALVLATSGEDHARILDAATGKELLRLVGHEARVWSAIFSPDGTRIVTTADDLTARVWDAATGKELARLEAWAAESSRAEFSPDSTRLLTVTRSGKASVSDAANGKELVRLDVGTRSIFSAVFGPDGSRLVTTMSDNTASLWNAATGTEIARFEGISRRGSAAFSPDGSRFVTTSGGDGVARVWDAATDGASGELAGHEGLVWFAAFSPDGGRVVTTSFDDTAALWDVATGREIARFLGHTANVATASFTPDGARLVTSSVDRTTRVWDAATSRELARFEAGADRSCSVALSPDGKRYLAWSEEEKTPRVWDAATGETLVRFEGHTGTVWGAAFSPDGTRVVTGGDRTARVWDADSGKELARMEGHTSGMHGVAFSPDGKRVATASGDHSARVWDAASAKELARMEGHTQVVRSVAFSPDGMRVVTTSEDKSARVWDAATGQELVRLEGHKSGVSAACFSPDGTRIVTASWDKTARVWDSVPYRVRYAERRSMLAARAAAERVVNEALSGPGSFAEAEARIRNDPALDATARQLAPDVLLERCSRARGQAIALAEKRAERTWISRMLGLEPWPSESDAEGALRAKGKGQLEEGISRRPDDWRRVAPNAPPEDEVQKYLLARRPIASTDEKEVAKSRSRVAFALSRLGRFDEALAAQRGALADAPDEMRTWIREDLARLESDVATWRDESGQPRRTEWTDRIAALTREIAELEQDPDVRRWLDQGR